ncbi:hypothetical protein ACLOJK_034654 [Asimina triloba]
MGLLWCHVYPRSACPNSKVRTNASTLFHPSISLQNDDPGSQTSSLAIASPERRGRRERMSSDSEDGELLDRAHRQQGQRDKAGSSTRHRAVIRPPPPPSFISDKSKKSSRAGADDDDDSDLEILSISSGDEDSSSRDYAAKNSRGQAPSGRKSSGGRDDDRVPDGGEPNCWKNVDEGALVRRVREMRETRAAPAALMSERKGVQGKKGLSNLQSLPRGMEFVDPLGLG